MNLHHIGIATDDAESLAARFESLLDFEVVHREVLDDVFVTFLELPGGYLEFLEPVESSTVQRFLDRRGPGLHHLAFDTNDIETTLKQAHDAGIKLVDEHPRPGAWGHEVAFLHPDAMGGILVEFVEETHPS